MIKLNIFYFKQKFNVKIVQKCQICSTLQTFAELKKKKKNSSLNLQKEHIAT